MGHPFAFIPDRFRPGLDLLLTAHEYAQDSQTDPWQFAVELSDLFAAGATLADIRWLVLRGFAEHARETTVPGDEKRTFRRLAPTSYPRDVCLVLTSAGAATIRSLLASTINSNPPLAPASSPPSQGGGWGG